MSQVPRWQADSSSAACYLCHSKFTLFKRRHHCRKCGQLVCADCSAQKVRYFAGSYVLNPSDSSQKACSHTYYRTCDVCADEINMIRATLVGASATETPPVPPSAGSQELASSGSSSSASSSPASGADADAENSAKDIDSAKTPANKMIPGRSDAESDADFCPVCGVDLWKQYSSSSGFVASAPTLQEEFESFKESHISSCLVAYDFTNDNLRLSSPPGGSHARNRMLVYNIPPIPEPKFETIRVDPNASGGPGGSSPHSVNTLSGSNAGAVDDADADVSGSTPSNTTFMGSEKDAIDAECVICLEDLRPGDKVGRLECLCVFHYKCIKDWFNKKSFAECPVHFLHS